MDDFGRLAPGTQKQLAQFLDRGYSARRIADLMELPWVVVLRIKTKGSWQ